MEGIDLSDLLPEFLSEAKEHLEALERGLLQLELSGGGEFQKKTINGLFRNAHTIKGSARVMGFEAVNRLAHAMEDVLGEHRDEGRNPDSAVIDRLLRAADRLRALLGEPSAPAEAGEAMILELRGRAPLAPPAAISAAPEVSPGEPASPAGPASTGSPVLEPTAAPGTDTIRVAVSRLDELLRLSGELVMGVQRLETVQRKRAVLVSGLTRFLRSVVAKEERLRSGAGSGAAVLDVVAEARRYLGEIESFRGETTDVARLLPSISERIEQEVMGLRLVPLTTVLGALPRQVRDLSREHGKEVELVVSGERNELDRRIIQGLSEPLLHLVRNAVDHGLETPAEREAAGKPRAGRLSVTASRRGAQVLLEVADDGRGLDPAKLRETAVKKRLLSEEAATALDDAAALELIYTPGFSTSALITSTSGRGVGMDAVVAALQRIGGSVELSTELGKGTRFLLALPLTVTIAHALLVEVGERVFALPSAGIERIVKLGKDAVQVASGREQLLLDGRPVPLLSVGQLLSTGGERGSLAVVVRAAGGRTGLVVSRIADEREIVLKPLGDVLTRGELASAATLLPDGSLVLVLDAAALVRAGRGTRRRAAEESAPRSARRILVADDSTPTRELERSILLASGFDVETAVDGADAWRKLQAGAFDLLITDVEMPEMTGFELTEAVRRDARFANLPVVIITSLDRESERRRGLTAGAQAYLVKNAFDQTALLETLERLLP